MIAPSGSINGAVDHTFGGAGDAEAADVLAAFGDIALRCGNPTVDYEMKATIDPHLQPTVKVNVVGKEESPDYPDHQNHLHQGLDPK